MPFTVSHAAAVLPFRRTRLPWSALVIGSFGPDFEYFLRVSGDSRAWHQSPDLFLYCFPFTLLAFYVFHLVIQRPVTGLLPASVQRRLAPAEKALPKNLADVLWLFAALALGLATHVLWDSFTHGHTWPTEHIAVLHNRLGLPFAPYMPGWAFLQFLSTILGLVILGIWLAVWYRTTPARNIEPRGPSAGVSFLLLAAMALVALAGATWRAVSEFGYVRLTIRGSKFQVLFVIAAIAWFLWEIFLYSLIVTMLEKRKEAHG